MKMAVFWVVAPGKLLPDYTALVNFYQTTWHYNPEDSHLSIILVYSNYRE
jgi:hypothetical protein